MLKYYYSLFSQYLYGICFLSLSYWLITQVIDVITQPITKVTVRGNLQYTNNEQIKAITQPFLQQRLSAVDVTSLQQQLKRLPWIKNVNIRKIWPNTLELQFSEKQPLAVWNGHWIVDIEGNSFFPDEIPNLQLVELNSQFNQEKLVLKQYLTFANNLQIANIPIKQVNITKNGETTIVVGDNTRVLLGGGDVIAKLDNFIRLKRTVIDKSDKMAVKIDLRYSNGAAIKWKH